MSMIQFKISDVNHAWVDHILIGHTIIITYFEYTMTGNPNPFAFTTSAFCKLTARRFRYQCDFANTQKWGMTWYSGSGRSSQPPMSKFQAMKSVRNRQAELSCPLLLDKQVKKVVFISKNCHTYIGGMCLGRGTYCCAKGKLTCLNMSSTLDNNGSIITEH